MQAFGDAAPNQPVVQPGASNPHWIEFQLVDTEGAPVPGEPYEVRLPDQSLRTGNTDREGKARFEAIIAGQATIRYTGLEKKEWKGVGSKGP